MRQPSGSESSISRDNWVNIMYADATAPSTTGSSAATVLRMQDKWVFVFHGEGVKLPA